ncbi:unnamed protein product [Closterium sp. NIES-54]
MVADSSDNNPKSNGGAEKKKERTAGQFFHIGEQGEQGDASAKVGAELHPLDYWVLDTGAAWTMTPRKELLDDVRAAPINEVCSASGHALKVAGVGRAAFKGADGKPVVLHDVLLVPDLKANLISLRKLAKAGVSTSTDGARTYKGQLGNRVLWDLHESKDVYRSMWQLPALAWHGGGQAGEGSASQGECNAVGGVGVKVSARSGETDWATAHRRLGHVAMPLLKQLEKDGAVKDRGGEFLGAEMTAWLKKQGIQRELTTAYTPQSNGVAERENQTILETARALLIESGVGNSMWPHAVRHATVARNRVLTKKQPETKVSQQMEQITMQLDLTPSVWEEGEEAAAEAGDGEKVQEAPGGGEDDVETIDSTKEAAGSEGGEQQLGKAKLTAGADVAEQQLGNEKALLILPHGYDPDEEDEPAYCFLAPAPEEPASMEEALAGPDRETVCKLKKSIYGLKQAPRCWYQKLVAVLEEMGFRTSSCDESLFLKGEGEKLVLFLVYVDDILLFSSSMKEIQKVQQQLMKNFKCKTLGEVKYYLGMHVERDLDHRWLKLHQEKFIKELGEKYGIRMSARLQLPCQQNSSLWRQQRMKGLKPRSSSNFSPWWAPTKRLPTKD